MFSNSSYIPEVLFYVYLTLNFIFCIIIFNVLIVCLNEFSIYIDNFSQFVELDLLNNNILLFNSSYLIQKIILFLCNKSGSLVCQIISGKRF
jgi:hypothetical protein